MGVAVLALPAKERRREETDESLTEPLEPRAVARLFTDQASGATNCRTDSDLRISVPGFARPIHCPGKFYSNRCHGTDYHLGRA